MPLRQKIVIALLGCFVIGIAWLDSDTSRQPELPKTVQANSNESSIWKPNDPISLYTLVLAGFSGLLVLISGIQIRYLIRADRTARRAAFAARRSANAARKAAEHIPRVERAYLSGGGEPIGSRAFNVNGVIQTLPAFRLDINNYGKTPGELLEYGIGWCDADKVNALPQQPEYMWYFLRDMIQPGIPSKPVRFLKIPGDLSKAVIFARYGYRDIFGQPHSDGFIQHGGKPIQAPHDSYTKADPPWDLPHVGKRQYEKDD